VNSTVHSGPLGLPHCARQADEYRGFSIPKGSIIILPAWAIQHSSNWYLDPEKFRPDRFEGYTQTAEHYANSSDYHARDHYGYGAGRRICPGIHLGERMQWRAIAKLLWAFEFEGPEDSVGWEGSAIDDAYTNGILHTPLPFEMSIKPRSERHIEILREEMCKTTELLQEWEER